MNYNLYLRYKEEEWLNIHHEDSDVLDGIAASIMYDTCEDVGNVEDDVTEPKKIGFVTFSSYNQVLAMTYGLNVDQIPVISLRTDSKIFKELDYAFISQETIDEIGTVTNPNILLLTQFGISPAFRNKGIGEQVLKFIMKQMKGQYGYMIIIKPEPAQFSEHCKEVYSRWGVEMDGLEKDLKRHNGN